MGNTTPTELNKIKEVVDAIQSISYNAIPIPILGDITIVSSKGETIAIVHISDGVNHNHVEIEIL